MKRWASDGWGMSNREYKSMNMDKLSKFVIGIIIIAVLVAGAILKSGITVPAGEVKVGSLSGKVNNKVYENGFHVVNPMETFTTYDVKNQSLLFEYVPIPTSDQLTSNIDVRVQYRIIAADTPKILENTGTQEQLINVKLKAQMFSILRDAAKAIPQAEMLFQSDVQKQLQERILSQLRSRLQPDGIDIQAILLSHIELPSYIVDAIKGKKIREQEVQREKAELQRVQIQSQQKVVQAKAEYEASEQQARSIQVLADAEFYRINKVSDALKNSPEKYIQIQALHTLTDMSKNASSKFYFLDPKSANPLPLLNLTGK